MSYVQLALIKTLRRQLHSRCKKYRSLKRQHVMLLQDHSRLQKQVREMSREINKIQALARGHRYHQKQQPGHSTPQRSRDRKAGVSAKPMCHEMILKIGTESLSHFSSTRSTQLGQLDFPVEESLGHQNRRRTSPRSSDEVQPMANRAGHDLVVKDRAKFSQALLQGSHDEQQERRKAVQQANSQAPLLKHPRKIQDSVFVDVMNSSLLDFSSTSELLEVQAEASAERWGEDVKDDDIVQLSDTMLSLPDLMDSSSAFETTHILLKQHDSIKKELSALKQAYQSVANKKPDHEVRDSLSCSTSHRSTVENRDSQSTAKFIA